MITQEYVKSLFDYDEGGFLIWKPRPDKPKTWNTRFAGKVAGTFNKSDGYFRVKVDEKSYAVHRLIFLWHKGYLPKFVDHKDTIKTHNWIDNLRESTKAQNQHNRSAPSTNSSGYKNISILPSGNYRVQIRKAGICYSNTSPTLEEAIEWRDVKLKELHGEFARTD